MLTEALQMDMVKAIASLYYCAYLFDLDTDTYEEIKTFDFIAQYVTEPGNAAQQMYNVMNAVARDEWRERVLYFSDLTTVAGRIGNKQSLSLDFQGIHIWARATFVVVSRSPEGIATKVMFIVRDIDNQVSDFQNLQFKYRIDPLTGLLNRSAFEDDLREAKAQEVSKYLVMVAADANGLKQVNDTVGHNAGDELLQGIAACLKQCLGNYGKLYRVGGDEFLAVLKVSGARLQQVQEDLAATVEGWRGKLVESWAMPLCRSSLRRTWRSWCGWRMSECMRIRKDIIGIQVWTELAVRWLIKRFVLPIKRYCGLI